MKKRTFFNPVIGDKATLVKTSEETNGEYSLFEIEVAPGGGNELHIHHTYAEIFRVLEGELTVHYEGTLHSLKTDEFFVVPPRKAHFFRNKTRNPVRFHVKLTPGQPGFEKAIAIAYGLAVDGKVNKDSIPKSIVHLAVLATMSETIPAGFLRVLMPVLKLIASFSKRTRQALIDQYC